MCADAKTKQEEVEDPWEGQKPPVADTCRWCGERYLVRAYGDYCSRRCAQERFGDDP